MENKGITLISLVVTIVVILILAGVTINTVFSENGIIAKAKEAANRIDEAIAQDQAELNSLLDKFNVLNETGGSTVPVAGNINSEIIWSTGSATLTLSTNVSESYEIHIQYKKNSASSWQNYTSPITNLLHGDTIYAQGILDGEIVIQETEIDILDTEAPEITVTTTETANSITVNVTASDGESGLATSGTYKYYLNNNLEETSTNNSYTFSGLTDDTQYTIKVEVTDNANNVATDTRQITTLLTPTVEETLVAGDYVTYVDGTGISRDCVVLYDSSLSYGIQIITMETVEDVELGSRSNSDTAMNSYNNAISSLNSRTSKYLNTDYASNVRSVGSVPNHPSYDVAGMFTSSYDYMTSYNGQFRDGDENYLTDWNQMNALTIQNIGEEYWLASRNVDSNRSITYFSVSNVDSSGSLYDGILYQVGDTATRPYSYNSGLRPVFTLKSGIKITGGSGTAEDPYTLGI